MTNTSTRTRCDLIREAEAVAVCPPWHLRDVCEFGEHPRGDTCASCERDIAVDRSYPPMICLCIYCGMNWGLVPEVVRPPEDGTVDFRIYRRKDDPLP